MIERRARGGDLDGLAAQVEALRRPLATVQAGFGATQADLAQTKG